AYAGGGYYCYVPIPYRKSCKIVLRAKSFQFYDLNYATYPAGTAVRSFDPGDALRHAQEYAKATSVFAAQSLDLTSFNVPAGSRLSRHPFGSALAPGKSVTLFSSKKPGRIAALRIGPAEAFAGNGRDILLRITWDGAKTPAVLCPAGDFFGYAWGNPSAKSSLIGSADGTDYCYLPMPYAHSAKIELLSLRRNGSPVELHGEVVASDAGRRPNEGEFCAVWRRENPTTEGKPFTFLDMKGRGHIVGLALQAQGKDPGSTPFFEGDDMTFIDGQMAIHGTGSEDFFNGGWYDVPDRWDRAFSRGLSGCLAYEKPMGRSGGFRFFLGDAYSFDKSIVQTIEHAPERNQGIADYSGVTYLYADRPPEANRVAPAPAHLRIDSPARIVFDASWSVPISSFSFADATLSRCSVPAGSGTVRCLSMRAKGGDFFGPPFISLVCNVPPGRYRVSIDAVKGPEQGIVQLFQDESPVGPQADLYSAAPAAANGIHLGTITSVDGGNRVMFKVIGQNSASNGLGLQLVHIVFVRLPGLG
ncbi:MAG TPA: glycoside hydrolase family 172 protein, partial [Fimbriimonadaceae bacterium]|nr:glycoside hydrolase family 172 protein [Fimbriimonadaceae bacterium]